MGSAYIAPDNSKIVVVYVNWGTSSLITAQNFKNIPDGYRIKSITPYVTDASNNLSVKTNIAEGATYTISPRSVTTMVIQLEKLTSVEFQNTDENKIKIYSLNHEIYVEGAVSSVEGYNMQGKAITKKNINKINTVLSADCAGIYIVKIISSNGIASISKVLIK